MERILVGLDASPRAKAVLSTAEALARRFGARLLLFRAVGIPMEIPLEAYSVSPDGLVDLLKAHAQRDMEELAATLPADLLLGTAVHTGTPWQAICAAAEAHNVDLIVIGSHGCSGLDHLLGTTAAKVVNHSSRSVLVVREPKQPDAHT